MVIMASVVISVIIASVVISVTIAAGSEPIIYSVVRTVGSHLPDEERQERSLAESRPKIVQISAAT